MLKLVRLVTMVTFCSGLGQLSTVPASSARGEDDLFMYSSVPVSPGASNLHNAGAALWRDSSLGQSDVPPWLQSLMKRVSTWLDGIIDFAAAQVSEPSTSNKPVVVVDSPGPAPAALTVEQVEASLVAQTNAARTAAGLPLLQVDATLTALARQRSQDMIDRDFFSHTDPATGGSLVEAYCIAPLGAAYCGENLAGAGGLVDAEMNVVGRWLASDGHRANMLRTEFGRVGIGVAVGGRWGAVVTQLLAP